MVLAMKEDLSLRWSHTASVYPKRPVPDLTVNKAARMQCMYLLSESLVRVSHVTLCSLNYRREFCLVHINFLRNL